MSLEVPGEYDPEPASDYVTEPVYDGVAVVAERGRLWMIASDKELRVFNHLPQELKRGRKPQLRDQRQSLSATTANRARSTKPWRMWVSLYGSNRCWESFD